MELQDKTLKKENQKLRNEVQTLMAELQSLKSEFDKIQDGSRSRSPTVDLTQVVQAFNLRAINMMLF